MREFNNHKLTPTSHYFERLLQKDEEKFNNVTKDLARKKQMIDNIVARYNKALNFQSCKEELGMFEGVVVVLVIFSEKNDEKVFIRGSMHLQTIRLLCFFFVHVNSESKSHLNALTNYLCSKRLFQFAQNEKNK